MSNILSTVFGLANTAVDLASQVLSPSENQKPINSIELNDGDSFVGALNQLMNAHESKASDINSQKAGSFADEYNLALSSNPNINKFDVLSNKVNSSGYELLNSNVNVQNFGVLANLSDGFARTKQMLNAVKVA